MKNIYLFLVCIGLFVLFNQVQSFPSVSKIIYPPSDIQYTDALCDVEYWLEIVDSTPSSAFNNLNSTNGIITGFTIRSTSTNPVVVRATSKVPINYIGNITFQITNNVSEVLSYTVSQVPPCLEPPQFTIQELSTFFTQLPPQSPSNYMMQSDSKYFTMSNGLLLHPAILDNTPCTAYQAGCTLFDYTVGDKLIQQLDLKRLESTTIDFTIPINVSITYRYNNFSTFYGTYEFFTPSLFQSPMNQSPASISTEFFPDYTSTVSIGLTQLAMFIISINNNVNTFAFGYKGNFILLTPLEGNSTFMKHVAQLDHDTYSYNADVQTYLLGNYAYQNSMHTVLINNLGYTIKDLNQVIPDPIFINLISFTSSIPDFSPNILKWDSIQKEFSQPFPFGYMRNNSVPNVITYTCSVNPPIGTQDITLSHLYGGSSATFSYPIQPAPDNSYPVIQSLYTLNNANQYYIVINITDEGSGACSVDLDDVSLLLSKYLVSGDPNNGLYMIPRKYKTIIKNYQKLFIAVYDRSANYNQMENPIFGDHLSNLVYEPVNYYATLTPSDFTYFRFIPNNINTFNGPVDVVLLFNVTNVDTNWTPYITFAFTKSQTIDQRRTPYMAEWDYTNRVYRVDFTVPKQMQNGTVYYEFNDFLNSNVLSSFVNVMSPQPLNVAPDLVVYSEYLDQNPPYQYITLSASPAVVAIGTSPKLTFNMTVTDQCGIDYIWVEITGSADGTPYEFFKSLPDQVFSYTLSMEIVIDGNNCVPQYYTITKITLKDKCENVATFPKYVNGDFDLHIDPTYYMLDAYGNQTYARIQVQCEMAITDFTPPELVSLELINFPNGSSVDVGTGPQLQFGLIVRDDKGLSNTRHPIIYLTEALGDTLILRSNRVNKYIQSTYEYANYTYQSDPLPYGFGVGGITVQVFGIGDKQFNLMGYTSAMLRDHSFIYQIPTVFSIDRPSIIGSTRVYPHGGLLTIRGQGFGSDPTKIMVNVKRGTSEYLNYVVEQAMYNYVIIDLGPAIITDPFITVQAQNSKYASNELMIDVSAYPASLNILPPTPISCPSNCNGNGNCTFDGCDCYSPWYGPSCSQKVIVIPNPEPSDTDPIIIIDTNGNSTTSSLEFKSIVSIYSIRELSVSGKTVQEYLFKNWTFTNQSETQFLYTTTLNNSQSTMFNVTIQWIVNQTELEFAGEKITLPPYSSKMSMSLSSYPFRNFLNTLQVVINVEFATKSGDCFTKQFGYGDGIDDLQWIKLNIDDKSLYGNFIRRAVVDGRIISIRNGLVTNDLPPVNNLGQQQSFIAINVPNYGSSVLLDPDFSHLLDVDGKSNGECQSGETKPKLSTGVIAAIVVGGAVFIAIVVGSTLYIRKVRREKKSDKIMQQKLKKVNI